MSAESRMQKEFISALKSWLAIRRADLAPLESGEVRLGHRGRVTDSEWADITDQQAEILRKEIAGIERTIDKLRKMRS